MSSDCIFCKIVRGEIPARKVYENDRVLAFHDVNPTAPVHVLLIPKVHIARLDACVEADAETLAAVMLGVGAAAKAAGLEDFRAIVNSGPGAGQTVFHLHVHILGGRKLTWPAG